MEEIIKTEEGVQIVTPQEPKIESFTIEEIERQITRAEEKLLKFTTLRNEYYK